MFGFCSNNFHVLVFKQTNCSGTQSPQVPSAWQQAEQWR